MLASVFLLISFIPLILWLRRKSEERRRKVIDRAKAVLKKREERSYRNLDSKNIIDAFEKAPGAFYAFYKEVPEEVLTLVKDGRISRITAPASRIMEKLTEMALGGFADLRTGMTSLFAVRSEDELLDETALDQIVVHVKRMAKEMHSVKSQVIDVPLWRLVSKENGEPSMRRYIGLLFLLSGIDIPEKIREDLRIAKEQDRIISDMEIMKLLKSAAYNLQEGKKREYTRDLKRIAFRTGRRLYSISGGDTHE
ncbi:MAG: hypothetical protein QXO55_07730 [Candidatus Korarchaeum sp.]